jgi:serine/threonine protein kinase
MLWARRDIKAQNSVVDEDGRQIKIIDFGLACICDMHGATKEKNQCVL